jgi:membrane associated rhomboid family serine protease
MYPLSLVVAGALALAASGDTWTADHGNGTYSNPLFYDEFSDPDLIRVGASGAISGILGGYLMLFPRNHVQVLTRSGVMAVPAAYMLGVWILIQLVSSVGSITQTAQGGGVAYLAHVGGFVVGLVLVRFFASGGRSQTAWA